jgi:hypothetical protein
VVASNRVTASFCKRTRHFRMTVRLYPSSIRHAVATTDCTAGSTYYLVAIVYFKYKQNRAAMISLNTAHAHLLKETPGRQSLALAPRNQLLLLRRRVDLTPKRTRPPTSPATAPHAPNLHRPRFPRRRREQPREAQIKCPTLRRGVDPTPRHRQNAASNHRRGAREA